MKVSTLEQNIDRLERNYDTIQEEYRDIVKTKKADIVNLNMPLLDTRTNKKLIGTLISDIVLQLLSYATQTERENIRQRQTEDIAAAKAQGKHLGRRQAIMAISASLRKVLAHAYTSCSPCYYAA